jgi:hypothetical protein
MAAATRLSPPPPPQPADTPDRDPRSPVSPLPWRRTHRHCAGGGVAASSATRQPIWSLVRQIDAAGLHACCQGGDDGNRSPYGRSIGLSEIQGLSNVGIEFLFLNSRSLALRGFFPCILFVFYEVVLFQIGFNLNCRFLAHLER